MSRTFCRYTFFNILRTASIFWMQQTWLNLQQQWSAITAMAQSSLICFKFIRPSFQQISLLHRASRQRHPCNSRHDNLISEKIGYPKLAPVHMDPLISETSLLLVRFGYATKSYKSMTWVRGWLR
jgi:hypothetical protein